MSDKQTLFSILDTAIERHCSDIYFLPHQKYYMIRFYVNGNYVDFCKLDFECANEYINYFKFQANMNISERRRPQLGSWQYCYQQISYLLPFFKRR